MRLMIAASALAIMAGCASTSTTDAPPPAVVDMAPPIAQPIMPNAYDLAMTTVDQLVDAGNEQEAIQRVRQLLGNPKLTDGEKAKALNTLGTLRYGDGNDVFGAIEAWDELIETYPDSPEAIAATAKRDTARGEATSLNFAVETGDLAPTEKFEYMFRLGNHQDAADYMLERNLKPDNPYLVDMFQIGYLCDDETLTGPAYDLVEPDGTARTVHFCEFGK